MDKYIFCSYFINILYICIIYNYASFFIPDTISLLTWSIFSNICHFYQPLYRANFQLCLLDNIFVFYFINILQPIIFFWFLWCIIFLPLFNRDAQLIALLKPYMCIKYIFSLNFALDISTTINMQHFVPFHLEYVFSVLF